MWKLISKKYMQMCDKVGRIYQLLWPFQLIIGILNSLVHFCGNKSRSKLVKKEQTPLDTHFSTRQLLCHVIKQDIGYLSHTLITPPEFHIERLLHSKPSPYLMELHKKLNFSIQVLVQSSQISRGKLIS